MHSPLDPTDQELVAYLDEMLAAERSAAVERLLREREDLRQRAAWLARRRDQGGHSLGEIWRRQRLSCPSRELLQQFSQQRGESPVLEYISFHLTVIGCRICQANLVDLQTSAPPGIPAAQSRRRRYFESSAGLLGTRSPLPRTPTKPRD
ncbi:hypothetical protein [Planctomicrobium sp. SH664]|uniref:hypothetical protein n=1 Tax=Planctomicrobium sp. SH664 TaxID=3448125 RepID=UPI003F5C0BC9